MDITQSENPDAGTPQYSWSCPKCGTTIESGDRATVEQHASDHYCEAVTAPVEKA